MSEIFWGREVLKHRCLRMPYGYNAEEEGTDNLKCLTPSKYKVLRDTVRYKIDKKKNIDDLTRALRMKKIGGYLTQKIYDCKRSDIRERRQRHSRQRR